MDNHQMTPDDPPGLVSRLQKKIASEIEEQYELP